MATSSLISSKSLTYSRIHYKSLVIASLLVIFLSKALTAEVAFSTDSYTDEELRLLPEFLARVDDDLTNDYMAENKYLVRFLRAKDLDIDEAEAMLRENLRWRMENNVDDLQLADFDELPSKNPAYLTTDRDGRPALVGGEISQINLRKIVNTGRVEHLLWYNYFLLDKTVEKLSKVSNETDTEFQAATIIFNLAGFNAKTHGCAICMPYITDLVEKYEMYYPQLAHKFIFVNSPKVLEAVIYLMKPLMSFHTQRDISVYGQDKAEWRRELMTSFDPSLLTPAYGGTLKLVKAHHL